MKVYFTEIYVENKCYLLRLKHIWEVYGFHHVEILKLRFRHENVNQMAFIKCINFLLMKATKMLSR